MCRQRSRRSYCFSVKIFLKYPTLPYPTQKRSDIFRNPYLHIHIQIMLYIPCMHDTVQPKIAAFPSSLTPTFLFFSSLSFFFRCLRAPSARRILGAGGLLSRRLFSDFLLRIAPATGLHRVVVIGVARPWHFSWPG